MLKTLQKLKKFVYGVNHGDIIFSSKAEKHILYFFKKRIIFFKKQKPFIQKNQ